MAETPGIALESKTSDGKLWVQSTSRPMGTFSCFTSEGDNLDSPVGIGNGVKMYNDHKIGDPLQQNLYVDFNVKENKTFICQGLGIWKSANFDEMHLHIVPKVTPFSLGTNTTFNLYGGFLIVPAAGDGMIQINPADIQLVEIPYSIDKPMSRQSAAFWDADYDMLTHSFSNIRPNIYGQGQYNIFGAEIYLNSVVDFIILGDGQASLHSADVAEFGHGMRCKFNFETNAPDHEWKFTINLSLDRFQTAEN